MNLHHDTTTQSPPVTSESSPNKAVLHHRENMMWIILIFSLKFSHVSTQRTDSAGEDGEL